MRVAEVLEQADRAAIALTGLIVLAGGSGLGMTGSLGGSGKARQPTG